MSEERVSDLLERSALDQDVNEAEWIEAHPVYCPIPWCTANTLRRARCGDQDGPYEGIHVARMRYATGQAARDRSEVLRASTMGLSNPGLAVGLARLHQEAVDMHLVPGRRGRRRLFPPSGDGEV